MRKKFGKLQKKENIIVFPGTFDRLLSQGISLVENSQYEEAIEYLEEAMQYDSEDPGVLTAYAYALYETGNYRKAKEASKKILQQGTSHYLDIMEMYISICIHLKEYNEAEQTISTLFEEGVIPPDRMEKFLSIKELCDQIVDKARSKEIDRQLYEISYFTSLSEREQQSLLIGLENEDYTSITEELSEIVQEHQVSPIIKTLVLMLLGQIGFDESFIIRKLGYESEVNPSLLPLPDQTPALYEAKKIISNRLTQDPTKEGMVIEVLIRHGFATYPFEWPEFSPEEIAEGYIEYVENLLNQREFTKTSIHQLIMKIEYMYQIRDV